jgi:hypothetical protein
MRARRVGTASQFRLYQNEQEIGRVDGTTVTFVGFPTRDDAALGASVAHRALRRRRKKQRRRVDQAEGFVVMEQGPISAVVAQAGILATLLPPTPGEPRTDGWGFAIELLPEEGHEVFAVARARLMWRALQGTGLYRRLLQFGGDRQAAR